MRSISSAGMPGPGVFDDDRSSFVRRRVARSRTLPPRPDACARVDDEIRDDLLQRRRDRCCRECRSSAARRARRAPISSTIGCERLHARRQRFGELHALARRVAEAHEREQVAHDRRATDAPDRESPTAPRDLPPCARRRAGLRRSAESPRADCSTRARRPTRAVRAPRAFPTGAAPAPRRAAASRSRRILPRTTPIRARRDTRAR